MEMSRVPPPVLKDARTAVPEDIPKQRVWLSRQMSFFVKVVQKDGGATSQESSKNHSALTAMLVCTDQQSKELRTKVRARNVELVNIQRL